MDASAQNELVTTQEDKEKKDANMQFGHCSVYIEKSAKLLVKPLRDHVLRGVNSTGSVACPNGKLIPVSQNINHES